MKKFSDTDFWEASLLFYIVSATEMTRVKGLKGKQYICLSSYELLKKF